MDTQTYNMYQRKLQRATARRTASVRVDGNNGSNGSGPRKNRPLLAAYPAHRWRRILVPGILFQSVFFSRSKYQWVNSCPSFLTAHSIKHVMSGNVKMHFQGQDITGDFTKTRSLWTNSNGILGLRTSITLTQIPTATPQESNILAE